VRRDRHVLFAALFGTVARCTETTSVAFTSSAGGRTAHIRLTTEACRLREVHVVAARRLLVATLITCCMSSASRMLHACLLQCCLLPSAFCMLHVAHRALHVYHAHVAAGGACCVFTMLHVAAGGACCMVIIPLVTPGGGCCMFVMLHVAAGGA
jgi:hypothetical protein